MDQSKDEADTCKQRQAQENSSKTIGLGFTSSGASFVNQSQSTVTRKKANANYFRKSLENHYKCYVHNYHHQRHSCNFSCRAVWLSVPVLIIMMTLACANGLVMYAVFAKCDPLTAGEIQRNDQVINNANSYGIIGFIPCRTQ